jgi:hypothetical protein
MARFDSLPADQKAVLQLLLKQGKSYDDLAGLLRTTPDQVRERALMALDALGSGDPQGLSDDRADEIADYLLGQQSATGRAQTRTFLEGSAAGRAWARSIAGELRPVAGDGLPEIPAEPQETAEAFDALEARSRARDDQASRSRIGGIVLLAGAGLLLALVILVLTGVIGGGDDEAPTSASTTTPTATTAPEVVTQINFEPAAQGSDALGVANVVRQADVFALAVIAQGLPAGNRYAVWLYDSPTRSQFLGYAPPVTGSGDAKGRLQGLAPLPKDYTKFGQVIVARQPASGNDQQEPTRPGTIILRGPTAGNAAPGGTTGQQGSGG